MNVKGEHLTKANPSKYYNVRQKKLPPYFTTVREHFLLKCVL